MLNTIAQSKFPLWHNKVYVILNYGSSSGTHCYIANKAKGTMHYLMPWAHYVSLFLTYQCIACLSEVISVFSGKAVCHKTLVIQQLFGWFSFWRCTDALELGQSFFFFLVWLILLCLFEAGGCFCESEDRWYSSLWNQSVAGPEVTAISALQSDITLIQKQLRRVFGSFAKDQLLKTF